MKCGGNHQSVSFQSLALACDTVHWVVISLTLSRRKQPNLISPRDHAAVTAGNTKATDIVYGASAGHSLSSQGGQQNSSGHRNGNAAHGSFWCGTHTTHTYMCVISQGFLTFLLIYWNQVFLCTGWLFWTLEDIYLYLWPLSTTHNIEINVVMYYQSSP